MTIWRTISWPASALACVLALAAPSGAEIGEGSCVGIDACFQGPGSVGTSSCVGDEACYQGPSSVGSNSCIDYRSCLQGPDAVGDRSCIGEYNCSQAGGTVGDDSCLGEDACRQGSHSIGNDSCHGTLACWQTYMVDPDPERDEDCGELFPCGILGNHSCNGENACAHLHANVGNFACNGPNACANQDTAVGDCQGNTVFVAECEPPICGDVNSTGTITAGDALTVLKLAVGQDVAYSCPLCGDGTVGDGEDCEAGNFNGKSCATLGFAGGTLVCTAGCRFDTTGCYGARFASTGATIVDHETGLEWEKKTDSDAQANAGDPHDVDNTYSWCAGFDGACDNPNLPFDGTAATDFLARLNGATGSCYAGHCDWRLPTSEELEAIVLPDASCNAAPCVVDAIFLPAVSADYWTATSVDPGVQNGYAYTLGLDDGSVGSAIKDYSASVRAVRTK